MSRVPIDLEAVRIANELRSKLPLVATYLKHVAVLGTEDPAAVARRICIADGLPASRDDVAIIADVVNKLSATEWRELGRKLYAARDRLPGFDDDAVRRDGA